MNIQFMPECDGNGTVAAAIKQAVKAYLERLLTETHGNVQIAADHAGVTHMWIRRHCQRLGIYPARYRERK